MSFEWDWLVNNEDALALVSIGFLKENIDSFIYIETDSAFIREVEAETGITAGDLVFMNVTESKISAILTTNNRVFFY